MTFADGMVRRASVRQRATLGRRHKERAHSGLQQVANGITFRSDGGRRGQPEPLALDRNLRVDRERERPYIRPQGTDM